MRGLLALLLLFAASPVAAQNLVVSDGPETVSLTIYRGGGIVQAINKDWPTGYALITETRTVHIAAGESMIRFEGVAEGMFPESAIVTGLPSAVREKNRDARLLSPSGLVDAYLKRQVTLTRTNKATGKIREHDAVITAGPHGGVILKTSEGFEALHCTGLPERMRYARKPEDLSAKPTLSILTQSDAAVTAKLTLTYMASGFDWQANYIAQVKERDPQGEGKVDLFAWLTIANGGNQSFNNANLMAIAGAPNRERRKAQARPTGGGLSLKCWPTQRTHQVPLRFPYDLPPPSMAPLPSPMLARMDGALEEVFVTARRKSSSLASVPVAVMVAEQEDLGDLKLYRVPEAVTVNAKGQKQVAMLVQPGAKFKHIYTAVINSDHYAQDEADSEPMSLILRGENKKTEGLGLPMPQGQILVYENSNFGPLLAGETMMKDHAVGQEVEIKVGDSPDVRITPYFLSNKKSGSKYLKKWKIKLTNARDQAVNAEIKIPYQLHKKHRELTKVDNVPTWKTIIPANGSVSLNYTLKQQVVD